VAVVAILSAEEESERMLISGNDFEFAKNCYLTEEHVYACTLCWTSCNSTRFCSVGKKINKRL